MKKFFLFLLVFAFTFSPFCNFKKAVFVARAESSQPFKMDAGSQFAPAKNVQKAPKNNDANPQPAPEIKLAPSAKAALLMCADTGTVIFENNADERLPIASMTKMMTLLLVFEAIDAGKISVDSKVTISPNAAAAEGSQAFLDAGQAYSVEDLIKTVVIASANDSAVALAEALCGTEKHFALEMNKKAQELGLKNTHFSNATGLPAAEHYSTARDCAKIYSKITNNALYSKYSRVWMDELVHPSGRKTELVNTNRLVKTYSGCSSGKTGYTSEAKYCLTCSATRAGTNLIASVLGEPDSKTRFSEVAEMFNFGFANFESKPILNAEHLATAVLVKGGKTGEIIATPEKDYYDFVKKGEATTLTYEICPFELRAPVKKGDKVGEILIVDKSGAVKEKIALIATTGDEKLTLKDTFSKIVEAW